MKTTEEKAKRVRRIFSGKEKSQAVLSFWAGRRKASAIGRNLGIASTTLDGWQRRALKGMLSALGPGETAGSATGLELTEALERLMVETTAPASEAAETTNGEAKVE